MKNINLTWIMKLPLGIMALIIWTSLSYANEIGSFITNGEPYADTYDPALKNALGANFNEKYTVNIIWDGKVHGGHSPAQYPHKVTLTHKDPNDKSPIPNEVVHQVRRALLRLPEWGAYSLSPLLYFTDEVRFQGAHLQASNVENYDILFPSSKDLFISAVQSGKIVPSNQLHVLYALIQLTKHGKALTNFLTIQRAINNNHPNKLGQMIMDAGARFISDVQVHGVKSFDGQGNSLNPQIDSSATVADRASSAR